jgi:hypothetical protein
MRDHASTSTPRLVTRTLASLAALALCLPLVAGTAFAQGGGGMGQGQMAVPDTLDVTEQDVSTYAKVAMEMQSLRREMMQKYGNPRQMDSTETAQARSEMRRRQQEIVQRVLQEEEMSRQRFQLIGRAAQQDSTIGRRIQQKMRQMMQQQQGGAMQDTTGSGR